MELEELRIEFETFKRTTIVNLTTIYINLLNRTQENPRLSLVLKEHLTKHK